MVVGVVRVVVEVAVLVVVEEVLLLVRVGTLTLVEVVGVTNLGKKEVMGRNITKSLTKRRRRRRINETSSAPEVALRAWKRSGLDGWLVGPNT